MRHESPTELYTRLAEIFQEPLVLDDAAALEAQLVATEAIAYEVSYTKASWYQKLLEERERGRMPREASYTEFDRKTMLEAATSVLEKDYAFLCSVEQLITQRIRLGTLFLR